MVLIVEKSGKKSVATEGKLVSPDKFPALLNSTRIRILSELAKKPSYASELSGIVKCPEQKVFYHLGILRNSGLVEIERKEEKRGGLAKYFRAVAKAFAVKLPGAEEFEISVGKEGEVSDLFRGFVDKGGKFKGLIVVGSPDPHGASKARGRDGHYSSDVAFLLGGFSRITSSVVRTDTEIKESERKSPLILIGGPVTNMLVGEANDHLQVRFDRERNFDIFSKKSKRHYAEDECGIIVRASNPWNPEVPIVVLAGKRFSGTKAAVLSLVEAPEKLREVSAAIVEGFDLDGDGIVDSVEIKESF